MRRVLTLVCLALLGSSTRAWAGEAAPEAPPAPAAVEIVGTGPAQSRCWNCSPCRSGIELQGHASLLTPDLEGPVSFDTGAPGQVLWDPLDYGVALGGRAAWSFPLMGWTATLGGTYWGTWDDSATTSGTLAVGNGPGAPAVGGPFANVTLTSEATLWGVDFSMMKMCVCTPCQQAGWGVGLRALSFDEEAQHSVNQVAAPPATLRAEAENMLLAAQVLGHMQWRLADAWDLRVRGSAFLGWLHKETDVTTVTFFAAGTQVPQHNEDDRLGFGGELEISVGWCACNGWRWSLGYGLLAMFDLTRADRAADFSNVLLNPGNFIDAGQGEDTLLAHRVFLGLSIDF